MINRRLLCLVLLCVCLPGVAWSDDAADAVCDRLLPKSTLATLAPGFAFDSFSDATDGEWSCTWKKEGQPVRRVAVRYVSGDEAGATARYQEAVAKLARYSPQDLPGIASAAIGITLGTSYLLYARTPQALVSVTASEGTREQAVAVAKYVVGIPSTTVAEARRALALARARPMAPPPPLKDVVVRRNGRPLECERLLPRAKIVAVFGDAYHLTFAADPRPDFSTCEWKRDADGYGLTFLMHGPAEFADANVAGAKEYFASQLKFSSCIQEPGSALPDLGLEGRVCGSGATGGTVIVRRANDVLAFGCVDCDRSKLVALARAALR